MLRLKITEVQNMATLVGYVIVYYMLQLKNFQCFVMNGYSESNRAGDWWGNPERHPTPLIEEERNTIGVRETYNKFLHILTMTEKAPPPLATAYARLRCRLPIPDRIGRRSGQASQLNIPTSCECAPFVMVVRRCPHENRTLGVSTFLACHILSHFS